MPAKGKSRITPGQRAKIAAGKAIGRTNKQIGAELDLHPDTVAKTSHDVRTTTLILRWKERETRRLNKGLELALGRLLRDLKARDADLYVPARRDLLRFVCAGDPPLYRVGDVSSTEGDFTLQELLETFRTVTTKRHPDPRRTS